MKTIIVGTDFSAPSRVAVRQAATLAHRFGGELLLVHAGAAVAAESCRVPDALSALAERALAEQEGILSQMREEIPDVDVQAIAVPKHPVEALCDVAAQKKADLVVVGTHGRTGLSRVLLGSVAEGVIRKCTRPVLISRSESDLRRILVPTDFSIAAELALDQAVAIASPGSEIEILHAWEPPDALLDAPHEEVSKHVSEMHSQFEALISPVLENRRQAGAALQFVAVPRAAVSGIVERSENYHYDCIVIGTQGRTGLRALVAGSVAQAVVRNVSCSVLVVPPPWRRAEPSDA